MKKDGKKRVWFLLIFCTAVFAAFLVRLYWMQFTMADHYAKKLEQASQTSYTVRIPAARGSIVDRSGTALVQDDTVYDLALCVPAPPDTEMAQTLQTLKELDLGGKDVETQLAAFCSAVSAGELPLAENLTQAQCQSLLAAGLPQSGAVRLTARGTRTAVDGTLAPQLLGGVGAMSAEQWAQKKAQGLAMDESIGQWGLEAAWEDALRGRAGSLKVTVDRSSAAAPKPYKVPHRPGIPCTFTWMLICSAPCAAHCSSKLKLYRPQSRKARAKKPAQGRLWWWMCRPAAFWRRSACRIMTLPAGGRIMPHWPQPREHRWSTGC